ncbi:hypothetical protein GQ44DRAFT_831580 [Phaeosphaeriaceae sp. PMI808]|nr:hypothetical protein GQ44DRAFT_831580 [Phaeosphaeriaceae sp. PMI808]
MAFTTHSWDADEYKWLFNSSLDPESSPSLCGNPWSDTEVGENEPSVDMLQSPHYATEFSSLFWDPAELKRLFYSFPDPQFYSSLSENSPSDTEHGLCDFDFSTYIEMSPVTEEMHASHFAEAAMPSLVSVEQPANDEAAAGQDAYQDDPLTLSPKASSSSLGACGSPTDTETCLEYGPAGDMKGSTGGDCTYITCPVGDERGLVELAHVSVKDMSGAQVIQNEGDAHEEHGSDQGHKTANHISFNQITMNNDPFAQNNGVSHERLGVSATGLREPKAKVANNAGTNPNREANPNDTRSKMYLSKAQGESRPSSDEAGDSPTRSGRLQVEAKGNKDETAQTPSKDKLGSRGNPILIDEEESRESSSSQSTPSAASIHDGSVDYSDESSQVIASPSGRPARNKLKRSHADMLEWGSPEFQVSEAENLESALVDAQTCWCAVKTIISDLEDQKPRLKHVFTVFKACWLEFCVEARDSESIHPPNVAELIELWKKVEQELKNVQGNRKGQHMALKFGRALSWIEKKTIVYNCIKEYSNSVDRKDEGKDKDFKDKKRPSKIRR